MKSDNLEKGIEMANLDPARLSSIKTEILVAFIFSILTTISWALVDAFFILTLVPLGFGFSNPYLPSIFLVFLIYPIVFLVLTVLSILVVVRVNQLRTAIDRNDAVAIKQLNSIGWAIIALIFTGVIPGIMLIIAHGQIEQLLLEASKTGRPMTDLEKLSQLKSLLDSGVITQAEFEEQKKKLLRTV